MNEKGREMEDKNDYYFGVWLENSNRLIITGCEVTRKKF